MSRFAVLSAMVLAAVASRLLPHPVNVAPVTALALFGAVNFSRGQAFLVPLAAMFLSDLVLGFHSTIGWVYGSFALIVCVGFWMKNHHGVLPLLASSLAGSVLFFVVTNFGVWMSDGMYPRTLEGLAACYVAAIPFFRNTVLGDLGYVGVLFGVFELLQRRIPALRASAVRA